MTSDSSTCPDCGSEAIEVDLVSRRDFLESTALAELEALAASWRAAKRQHVARYHGVKAGRIRALLDAKRAKTKSR